MPPSALISAPKFGRCKVSADYYCSTTLTPRHPTSARHSIMGAKGGSQTLYHLTGLCLVSMAAIIRGLFAEKKENEDLDMALPTIDADINNICYKAANKSNRKSCAVAHFLRERSLGGIKVVPVVDGDVRPNCKQASNERRAGRELKRVEGLSLLKEVNKMRSDINNGAVSSDKVAEMNVDIAKKENDGRKKMNQSECKVPADLAEALEDAIVNDADARSPNQSGGFVDTVLKAKFEADAAIVGRWILGLTLLALSNDSDLPIIGGDGFPVAKEYMKDGTMVLVSTSKSTLENLIKFIPEDLRGNVKLEDAPYPIFENVKSRELRALIMVALGCDLYKSGIPNIGPKRLSDQMDAIKEDMNDEQRGNEDCFYQKLLKHVAEKTKLGEEVITTLVKGIIYHPTNYISCENVTDTEQTSLAEVGHTYYDKLPPLYLPEYLEDFKSSETNTVEGPEVAICMGVGSRPHKFLADTGSGRCHHCNSIVCEHCHGELNKKVHCLQCLAAQLMVPSRDGGYTERIAKMRAELGDRFRHDGVDNMTPTAVEEAYEKAIETVENHQRLASQVKYPLYQTAELKDPTKWKSIHTMQFRDGGSFIAHPSLRSKVPGMLNLFAAFATYEKKKHTDWVKDGEVYDALPSVIINMAKDSRVNTGSELSSAGYRLLERCVRAGTDPKFESLYYNSAQIIELLDGQLGLLINAVVPASMRDQRYNTTIAHTAKDILAVECNCKSGSKDDDRIVCVHNPSILYKLTELLLEDLAEHILLELTAILDEISESWTAETMADVKESVVALMEAAGEIVSAEDQKNLPLGALVDNFLTGTEKTKMWGRGSKSSKPSQQGPIDKLDYSSATKIAKDLKKKNKIERKERKENQNREDTNLPDSPTEDADVPESPTTENETVPNVTTPPDYLKSHLLIHAAGIDLTDKRMAGLQLFAMRAKKQMGEMNVNDVMELRAKADENWKKLQEAATKRSVRRTATQNLNVRKKRKRNDTQEERADGAESPNKRPNASSSEETRRCVTPSSINKPPEKKHSWCCKEGCNNHNLNCKTPFHRIPTYPAELSDNASKQTYIKREGKILARYEAMDRAGFKRGIKTGTYRMCEEHEYEWVVKAKKLTWKGERWYQLYNLYVPKGAGRKSTMCLETKDSRGNGLDRMIRRRLEALNKQIESRPAGLSMAPSDSMEVSPDDSPDDMDWEPEDKVAAAEASAAESRKVVQQMAEVTEDAQEPSIKINPSVARAAGLPVDTRLSPPVKTEGKTFFRSEVRQTANSKAKRVLAASKPPLMTLDIEDSDVQRRTGFPSKDLLLAYVFIICDGDVDLITRRSTSLTWFEEWMFGLEFTIGKSLTRWEDAENQYGVDDFHLRKVLRQKVGMGRRARDRWPMFASYEEDHSLWKPKYEEKYGETNGGIKRRPIFWDMTGIRAYQFGAAELQRDTYSKYYAGNCFKGGIFIQLCGWMGNYDLWGGNVSDTKYNNDAGYLQDQAVFQRHDLVDGAVVPWTNVFDKGYRARAACLRAEGQLTSQPEYAKSDQRFKGSETMYSASIASDRGSNERGVNVSKRSGMIKRGFQANMDAKLFQDVWIAWGFQVNFMYNPVV